MAEKEYIERDAVLKKLKECGAICEFGQHLIKNFPAADVAPVKHGHWKKGKSNERLTERGFIHDYKYICSCCGWDCCCETKLDFSFCPNCGAKMDGGEGE